LISIGQKTTDTIYRNYNTIDDLLINTHYGVKLNKYCDSLSKYEIDIPDWLTLKETNNDFIWGGKFPSINGIENAFVITSFKKDKFSSFNEFERIYLTGNVFGKPTLYSTEHIWYGQHKLEKIENGVQQRVFIFWKNHIYHDKFVLIETPSSYLWIQFTSTPDTYDKNLPKFEQIMKGLRIIK
jgi:hypothetical protein